MELAITLQNELHYGPRSDVLHKTQNKEEGRSENIHCMDVSTLTCLFQEWKSAVPRVKLASRLTLALLQTDNQNKEDCNEAS